MASLMFVVIEFLLYFYASVSVHVCLAKQTL